MVRLLGHVFAGYDPPAVAVGLTPAEFEQFVQLWCRKAAQERLTILARSEQTGELVGALLTEDAASPMPDGLDGISPKFLPIFDILGGLDAAYRNQFSPRPGEALHLFLLGVDRRFGGQGIAQRLVQRCLANGMERGFQSAVTEATNRRSQHIFRKLGFTERVRASYVEHVFEGAAHFSAIAGEGGPILMDLQLRPAGSGPEMRRA